MIGLILIYWVGKTYYKLAEMYDKNKWVFAILGVVSYYGGLLGGGFVLSLVLWATAPDYMNTVGEFQFTLMCIPLGIGTCFGFYQILKHNWKKKANVKVEHPDVIDEGVLG